MDIQEQLNEVFEALQNKRALIHHITNYVTVNDCANVVLAMGASPIMADELSEVEEMVGICDALVLNIGTANERIIASMLKAGRAANAKGIPVVLDPVGVGATPFRRKSVAKLMDTISFSVIRGNMAEIKTIAGLEAKSAGVDSLDEESDGAKIALTLAKKLDCVIAITGKMDIVSDGVSTYSLDNGDVALTKLTGTGCMSSSLIGSFLGASNKALASAIAGILTMSIAGEIANKSQGMGTFHTSLIDAISQMDVQRMINSAKIDFIK
ncbi:hydroxyethylthiazole kinase [Sulfurospirillum halorespirans]|uniref:Hydroxyethylthiazole kinase n=1 Tax=Sulfurospirillum halorespirans DSM 13726 TaxID=1193502 RepID=A0A1D7TJB1_9BACT|nr:hydroxyethylthiazole kinase [Sulfurospirillum halorespirans]AOO65105.1 hydroxyethylthiazole kinase [Sulfurospirillum halorespirans DSM 13726]